MKHIFYILALLFLVACSENEPAKKVNPNEINTKQWDITEQKIAANCEFDEQEVLGRLQMEGTWNAYEYFLGCDNGEYGTLGNIAYDIVGGTIPIFEFMPDNICYKYSELDLPPFTRLYQQYEWSYDHATRTLTTCTAQAIVRSVSDTEIILDGGLCGFECGYDREWEGDPTKKIYYPDHGIFYRFVLTFNSDKSYWEDAVEFNEHIE